MRAYVLGLSLLLAVAAGAQTSALGWRAPAAALQRKNPLTGSDAAAGGRKLFLRHCTECHGESGAGKRKGAADLTSETVQQRLDGELFWKITNGKADGHMPSFSRLPELQRWQLVLYIRAIARPADFSPK